ncbi:hypothetical protein N9521_02135 [Gammaproteobacteria bacterium]|nr:hypothetical protein [Gammaproteobacteria bacterium]MDB9861618.1 hypothetical protein [Gammaproteobacteria bacterium]
MIENFLQYGQWAVLVLSIYSLYLVSSIKHETRLNGYIFTAISRFSGALIFLVVDLPAFVIANLIQTYIAIKGYLDNKKAGKED